MLQIATVQPGEDFASGFDIVITWDEEEIHRYNREALIDVRAEIGIDGLREAVVSDVLAALRELGIEQTPVEVLPHARMIAAAAELT